MIDQTTTTPAGGALRCLTCLHGFATLACERFGDLEWAKRGGLANLDSPAIHRSLRAHVRACGWCVVEADTDGEHHEGCEHAPRVTPVEETPVEVPPTDEDAPDRWIRWNGLGETRLTVEGSTFPVLPGTEVRVPAGQAAGLLAGGMWTEVPNPYDDGDDDPDDITVEVRRYGNRWIGDAVSRELDIGVEVKFTARYTWLSQTEGERAEMRSAADHDAWCVANGAFDQDERSLGEAAQRVIGVLERPALDGYPSVREGSVSVDPEGVWREAVSAVKAGLTPDEAGLDEAIDRLAEHRLAGRTQDDDDDGGGGDPAGKDEDDMTTDGGGYRIDEHADGWTVTTPEGYTHERATAAEAQALVLGIEQTLAVECSAPERLAVIDWHPVSNAGRAVGRALCDRPMKPAELEPEDWNADARAADEAERSAAAEETERRDRDEYTPPVSAGYGESYLTLRAWLNDRGGRATVGDARAAGFALRVIDRAVAEGVLLDEGAYARKVEDASRRLYPLSAGERRAINEDADRDWNRPPTDHEVIQRVVERRHPRR